MKKMNKPFKILLTVFLFAFSTSLTFSQNYRTKEIKSSFNKQQINDLKVIVNFFTVEIRENENDDFVAAFEKILPKLNESGFTPILETLDFEKQKQMYKQISPDTFGEIWTFGKSRYRGDSITYKSIGFKYSGSYFQFLEKLGKTQPVLEKYYKDCMDSGSVESYPYLQYNIKQLPDQFDLSDFNIQLLISVHYLTVNDENKRKERWDK
nr:hypothetical protein [uncultured Draconibacterium sp.]